MGRLSSLRPFVMADMNLGGLTFEGEDNEELGRHSLSYNLVGRFLKKIKLWRFLHDHSIRRNAMKIRMTEV